MGSTDDFYSRLTKEEVQRRADEGDARAVCEIGIRCMQDRDTENYRDLARESFQKAAELGEPEGYACLGDFYDDGDEGDDLALSAHYYELAAGAGNTRAMYILATFYEAGDGVRKSKKKAYEYYLMGAEAGDSDCQLAAGQCLLDGEGVPRSAKKGYSWVEKSAAQGNGEAYYEMACCCLAGTGVKKDIGLYLEYLTKAAELDVGDAQAELSAEYYYGELTAEDSAAAVSWAQKAAWRGNLEGQLLLGIFYSEGYGCRKDTGKACHWLKKAAEQESASALNVLDEMYLGKEITAQKYTQVIEDILNGHADLIEEGEKELSGWIIEPDRPMSDLFAEEFLAGAIIEMEDYEESFRIDFRFAKTNGGLASADVRYTGNGLYAVVLAVTEADTMRVYAKIMDEQNLYALLKSLVTTLKKPRMTGWILGEEHELES